MLAQALLDLRLLGRARAQLGGDALAGRAVGGELGLEHLDARGDGRAAPAQRRGEALGGGLERLVARDRAVSRSMRRARSARSRRRPLGDAPLGGELALDLGAAHRGGALAAGAARRCSISQAARRSASRGLGARRGRPRGARGRPRRGVASAAATAAAAASTAAERVLLGCAAGSVSAIERVAAVALGQHALLAARRGLAQLAGGARTRRGRRR